MIKILAGLLLTGSIGFAAVIQGSPPVDVREYQALGVEKIHVENSGGRIQISPLAVDRIEIRATLRIYSDKCSYTVEKSDYAEIIVRIDRSFGNDCEVDLDLKVPKQVDLNIASESGAVTVKGVEGNLQYNLGSGSINADGKFKKVEGRSLSAVIDLNGLTSGGTVNAGSGPVALRFLEYPMGQMDVRTNTGAASIAFPKDSRVNVSLSTASGRVNNEIGSNGSADFGLSVRTDSGDMNVKAY